MEDILSILARHTCVLEINPNCPSPYLVRLTGAGGCIDKMPPGKTGDMLGYGTSLREAFDRALALQEQARSARLGIVAA